MNSRHPVRTMLALVASVLLSGAAAFLPAAHAGTRFKVLYRFTGGSDAYPKAGLIQDKKGNLYGTAAGGTRNGYGSIFKLAPDGTETVLYTFAGGNDGEYPQANLIQDERGNLLGTTYNGGGGGDGGLGCCGTVFRLTPRDNETVVHAFDGYHGAFPTAGLIEDKAGNLYGTTSEGGTHGKGTLFVIEIGQTERMLYAFAGRDGAYPLAGLIRDKAGNLYGTTSQGGAGCGDAGCGVVFKLAPGGTETVLHAFRGYKHGDGAFPAAGLIVDKAGNFYGTTELGGGTGCQGYGCGTVFKLAPDGTETVLYAFAGGSDGAYPEASLIRNKAGNLYGTTSAGGGNGCAYGRDTGCGTVFKLAPNGSETVLYAFHQHRGRAPQASLIKGEHGQLYGTASEGGGGTGCPYGCGTVFRLKE